jgi:hypothetical protein
MNRTDIIQSLINNINAKSYLEIGISEGYNWREIKCEHKVSVDPEPLSKADCVITSDEFFKKNKETFDVIFVDGLHHADQVYRDIVNSIDILNEGGYIVCHDMNPLKEEHQVIPFTGGTWNGDCWKAFVNLRATRKDLEMYTVNTDHGCGIIKKGKQKTLNIPDGELQYKDFDKNRVEWLNLISTQKFGEMFGIVGLKYMLKTYIMDPNNPETNWNLALYYDTIGQLASAISFYIRTAERTEEDLLKYECLIRAAMCFEKQGTRRFTVKGIVQHAIATQPHRPEGYYLLSKFYENDPGDGKWFDSYTTASIGYSFANNILEPLRTVVDYPGKHALLFQKAHTAWWCGLSEDCRSMLMDLYTNYDLKEEYRNAVYENLARLGAFQSKSLTLYTKDKHGDLANQFGGSENIEQNYSEAYQDMFVLTLFGGKKNGSYVEIGSGHPTYGNNTYLLEKDYGWNGVSLDISEQFVAQHNQERKHTCILKDATTVNYEPFLNGLGFGKDIDYLQIDCDPPEISYKVLLSIPFDTKRFGVITFEHDHYADPNGGYREKSRKYLAAYGYQLVAGNISPDKDRPYEDWYIHPDIINIDEFRVLKNTGDSTKMGEDYMMGRITRDKAKAA